MKTAFIFHGTGADPGMHWFPWLKDELEERDLEVFIPEFPTPEGQSRENWLKVFREYGELLDEDTILIGHSTGAVFAVDVLQEYDTEVAGCFLVAGFTGALGSERFDPLNETFAERDFDWASLRSKADQFYLYHSEDDP
jgi:predicted alpha/beta hydrolase family esterase